LTGAATGAAISGFAAGLVAALRGLAIGLAGGLAAAFAAAFAFGLETGFATALTWAALAGLAAGRFAGAEALRTAGFAFALATGLAGLALAATRRAGATCLALAAGLAFDLVTDGFAAARFFGFAAPLAPRFDWAVAFIAYPLVQVPGASDPPFPPRRKPPASVS